MSNQVTVDNTSHTLNDGRGNLTFEQYKVAVNNPNLIALPWDECYEKYFKPFDEQFQQPWKEISPEEFSTYADILPGRIKFTDKYHFFICEEAHMGHLHSSYLKDRITGKCYSAIRSRFDNIDGLYQQLVKQLENSPLIDA